MLFFLGVYFFLFAFLEGELHVRIIVIIPFMVGSGVWSILGFLLIFLSFLLYMFHSFLSPTDNKNILDSLIGKGGVGVSDVKKESEIEKKGVILIGLIPIVFGFNKSKSFYIGLALMILSVFILFLLIISKFYQERIIIMNKI